jgi:hypothetical protein
MSGHSYYLTNVNRLRTRNTSAAKTVDEDLAWMTPAERRALRIRVVAEADKQWSRREGGANSRRM